MYAPLSKRGEFIDPFIEDEAAQEMQKTHASITAYERMLIAIMCLCIVIFFTGVALFIWMRKILKVKAEAK